jgi:hypothetical protein
MHEVMNMLICMFQSNFKESLGYDMIILGSEIPKWFMYSTSIIHLTKLIQQIGDLLELRISLFH